MSTTVPEVNVPIVKEWVRRLRSGEWPQGTGALRTYDGYCCLGVLEELAVEHGVAVTQYNDRDACWEFLDAEDPHPDDNWQTGVLSPAVVAWAGVGAADPVLADANEDSANSLTASQLNDGIYDVPWTFNAIAGAIEERFLPEGEWVR